MESEDKEGKGIGEIDELRNKLKEAEDELQVLKDKNSEITKRKSLTDKTGKLSSGSRKNGLGKEPLIKNNRKSGKLLLINKENIGNFNNSSGTGISQKQHQQNSDSLKEIIDKKNLLIPKIKMQKLKNFGNKTAHTHQLITEKKFFNDFEGQNCKDLTSKNEDQEDQDDHDMIFEELDKIDTDLKPITESRNKKVSTNISKKAKTGECGVPIFNRNRTSSDLTDWKKLHKKSTAILQEKNNNITTSPSKVLTQSPELNRQTKEKKV